MAWFYEGSEIAASIVEVIIILNFLNKLIGCKYEGKQYGICFTASCIVIGAYMVLSLYLSPQYSAFTDIIALALYMAYTLLFTKGNMILRLSGPAICIILIVIINVAVYSLFSSLLQFEAGSLIIMRNMWRIAALIITKLAWFLITQLLLYLFRPRDIALSGKELAMFSITFLVSAMVILFSAELQYTIELKIIGYFCIVLWVGIVVINITTFILLIVMAKKNEDAMQHTILEASYQEQKKYNESVGAVYQSMKILQHDLKNDMLVCQSFLEKGDIQHALAFIEGLTQSKLGRFHEYVFTGSDLVDAILNIKLNYAREHSVEIFCNIGADFGSISQYDIVSLFANTIDNAMEASLQKETGRMVLTMENRCNYLCITIGNTIWNPVSFGENNSLPTTKADKENHGFGTQSVQEIADKYDGMVQYYEKNGMFFVDVMMKM